eukprot:TRINITY_DN4611_c0_g1_i2.p1 TRINITY_DN4611_c0_g1~~TRINITY_DN4611_c0_g1_i2.p1  ORF type:complete len:1398 (-),score=128.70 TRINITY_DN4611_c0_g1_i2:194-4387(-)
MTEGESSKAAVYTAPSLLRGFVLLGFAKHDETTKAKQSATPKKKNLRSTSSRPKQLPDAVCDDRARSAKSSSTQELRPLQVLAVLPPREFLTDVDVELTKNLANMLFPIGLRQLPGQAPGARDPPSRRLATVFVSKAGQTRLYVAAVVRYVASEVGVAGCALAPAVLCAWSELPEIISTSFLSTLCAALTRAVSGRSRVPPAVNSAEERLASTDGELCPKSLAQFCSWLLLEVPRVPPGTSLFLHQLIKGACMIDTTRPALTRLPQLGGLPPSCVSLQPLVVRLGISEILLLVRLLLLERQVVLRSSSAVLLAHACEALAQVLLFPLTWRHPYVPLISPQTHLSDNGPWIYGLHRQVLEVGAGNTLIGLATAGSGARLYTVFDLDTGEAEPAGDIERPGDHGGLVPKLPCQVAYTLREGLAEIRAWSTSTGDLLDDGNRRCGVSTGNGEAASLMVDGMNPAQQPTWRAPSWWPAAPQGLVLDARFNFAVQRVFFDSLAILFGPVRRYLDNDRKGLFDARAYVAHFPVGSHRFCRSLTETDAFQALLDDMRLYPLGTSPLEVALRKPLDCHAFDGSEEIEEYERSEEETRDDDDHEEAVEGWSTFFQQGHTQSQSSSENACIGSMGRRRLGRRMLYTYQPTRFMHSKASERQMSSMHIRLLAAKPQFTVGAAILACTDSNTQSPLLPQLEMHLFFSNAQLTVCRGVDATAKVEIFVRERVESMMQTRGSPCALLARTANRRFVAAVEAESPQQPLQGQNMGNTASNIIVEALVRSFHRVGSAWEASTAPCANPEPSWACCLLGQLCEASSNDDACVPDWAREIASGTAGVLLCASLADEARAPPRHTLGVYLAGFSNDPSCIPRGDIAGLLDRFSTTRREALDTIEAAYQISEMVRNESDTIYNDSAQFALALLDGPSAGSFNGLVTSHTWPPRGQRTTVPACFLPVDQSLALEMDGHEPLGAEPLTSTTTVERGACKPIRPSSTVGGGNDDSVRSHTVSKSKSEGTSVVNVDEKPQILNRTKRCVSANLHPIEVSQMLVKRSFAAYFARRKEEDALSREGSRATAATFANPEEDFGIPPKRSSSAQPRGTGGSRAYSAASMLADLRTRFCDLQACDPTKLSHDERLTFWLNVLNAGVLAWSCFSDRPSLNRGSFFPKTSWMSFLRSARLDINGHEISLYDIEHNMLRSRSHSPLRVGYYRRHRDAPPEGSLATMALSMPAPEASFGVAYPIQAGYPPLRIYRAEVVRPQLLLNCAHYISRSLRVDLSKKRVYLPALLSAFKYEFFNSPGEILEFARATIEAVPSAYEALERYRGGHTSRGDRDLVRESGKLVAMLETVGDLTSSQLSVDSSFDGASLKFTDFDYRSDLPHVVCRAINDLTSELRRYHTDVPASSSGQ